ncbi:unnamed protein product, partial [Didymodactylos carnosus]
MASAATSSKEYVDLKAEIRALLISAKDGLTEDQLMNDYRSFNSNKSIPYAKFGFHNLVELLKSMEDACRIQYRGQMAVIVGIANEQTHQIFSLVKGQRRSKKRRGRGGGYGGRGGAQRSYQSYGMRETNRGGANRRGGNYNRGGGRGSANSSGRFILSDYSNKNNYNSNNYSDNKTAPRFQTTTTTSKPSNEFSFQKSNNHSSTPLTTSTKQNVIVPPRFAKQYEDNQKSTSHSLMQLLMGAPTTSSVIPTNYFDDRRVENKSESLRITVLNNKNSTELSQQSSPAGTDVIDEDLEEEYFDDDEEETVANIRSLLSEHPYGIRLRSLNDVYKKKFGKDLFEEMKLSNILQIQEYVDHFATLSREDEQNGSCDLILALKNSEQQIIRQISSNTATQQLSADIRELTSSAKRVSKHFRYQQVPLSICKNQVFQGFVPEVDTKDHILYIQPVVYDVDFERLMKQINAYYSNPASDYLIVNNLETDVAYVTIYSELYCRVLIRELDPNKCVVSYVDYGFEEEIGNQQFKYLLDCFADLPAIAMQCRLYNIRLSATDKSSPTIRQQLINLCENGPFYIKPKCYLYGNLCVEIYDADNTCLNDIIIQHNIGVKQVDEKNKFCALHCPLPDSDNEESNEPSPLPKTSDQTNNFKDCTLAHSIIPSKQCDNQSTPPIVYSFKKIKLDHSRYFYLIRYQNNKPFLPCFDLARLLHLNESNIIAETLLSRVRLLRNYLSHDIFDYFINNIPNHKCVHLPEGTIFLFDIQSTIKYIEKIQNNQEFDELISALRQQFHNSVNDDYWYSNEDTYHHIDTVRQKLKTLYEKQNVLA